MRTGGESKPSMRRPASSFSEGLAGKGAGSHRVVLALEKAEEGGLLLLKLVVVLIDHRGDPSDVSPLSPRHEELQLRMLQKWILVGEDLRDVVAQGGDPVRIALVGPVRDVEEPVELFSRSTDGFDGDRLFRHHSLGAYS